MRQRTVLRDPLLSSAGILLVGLLVAVTVPPTAPLVETLAVSLVRTVFLRSLERNFAWETEVLVSKNVASTNVFIAGRTRRGNK